MTNLLPPHARKSIVLEYWARVSTVWSVLLMFALIASGLLLLPTYRLIESQLKFLSIEAENARSEDSTVADAERVVRDTNALAAELSREQVTTKLSTVIEGVNSALVSGVQLRTYDVAHTDGVVEKIQIQGTASTREALAAFKNALEDQALFSGAEVPISDLVRDTNLPFLITVEVAESFK